MKKLLRKKRRIGEFQELGFSIDCWFVDGFSDVAFDSFWDAFIDQAIEANNLLFGGGGDRTHWGGFVTSAKRRGSTTETDRSHLQEWLESRPEIIEIVVGQLVDAWK